MVLDTFFDLLLRIFEFPARGIVFLRRLSKWQKRSGHYLVPVANRDSTRKIDQSIPTVLYQTTSSKLVDHEHFDELERFRDMNPELDFVVMDEAETDSYMKLHWREHAIYDIYMRALFGQIKADIFRLCVIYERGGYYCDINKAAFINLVGLHERSDRALLTFDRDDCIIFPPIELAEQLEFPHKLFAQWAFGFAKGHEIPLNAINRIVEMEPYFAGREFASVRDAIFAFSGPGMLTYVIRIFLCERGLKQVSIAGRYFFGTGYMRVRGAQRTPRPPLHYTVAKSKMILLPASES